MTFLRTVFPLTLFVWAA